MISKRVLISTAIAAVATMGTATASAQDKANDQAMEKCYGVVAAGKNDCAGNGHACQGQAKTSGDGGEFIALPAGVCERLNGGSTAPSKKMDKM